jgi:hypothetical protein
MESLTKFIEDHFITDKSRSSFSNLIKKIKLENELFNYINNYVDFGTFKQKLYHFINNIPNKLICPVCSEKDLNWVDRNSSYRTTCSTRCSGKLTGKKNNPKKQPHPTLDKKEEFIRYFNTNKIKLIESSLFKFYPNLVNSINKKIKFKTEIYAEKVYFYLYDLKSRPICEHCNYNTVDFDTFTKGYHKYCSVKCSSNSDEKKDKIKETCIEKYGVENIGQVTREKAMETMIERYGGHISKTEQFKEKYKNTSFERYGVDHISKTEQYKNKYKKTSLERYGATSPMMNKNISERSLKTKKDNGSIYKWTEQELKDIKSYRRAVSYYTEKTYEKYKYILNPDNLERGIYSNHIDHIFPVIEGWKNKIDPKLISHHSNLRLVDSYENLSKGDRTQITFDEFISIINNKII